MLSDIVEIFWLSYGQILIYLNPNVMIGIIFELIGKDAIAPYAAMLFIVNVEAIILYIFTTYIVM